MAYNLPALPSLGADETLAFFTHNSIHHPLRDSGLLYGDHDGLESLGRDMLRSCVYEVFFRDHPDFGFSVDTMKVCDSLMEDIIL